MSLLAEVQFGREVCGDLEAAEAREWLVTNGLGGFASGTVAGTATRRYHALLVAALRPPVERKVLVAGLDESARYRDNTFPLSTNRWVSGFVSPSGYLQIESFFLEGTKPVWRYAFADALLEKRVWMKQGENTTCVQYTLLRGSGKVEIDAKVLVNYRDFHLLTQAGDWPISVEAVEDGLKIRAFDGAAPFYLKSARASVQPRHEWYRDYLLSAEKERGLDYREDRLFAAHFHFQLDIQDSVTLVFTTEEGTSLDGEAARAEQSNHDLKLFRAWQEQRGKVRASPAEDEPGWLWQLVLAADQFVVRRAVSEDAEGLSLIAGYHWFGDWGRDTMIALPGLTLPLGRPEIARKMLLSFSRYLDAGMLPNHFPDSSGAPQYNTVDAALWYFEAVRQYYAATQDLELVKTLFPALAGIVDAYVGGTRYNIMVDSRDALVFAGSPEVQLTWMDAKVGDWVVTPRMGKPVEVNALWINALRTMMDFARLLSRSRVDYEKLAEKATRNFQKFWNVTRGCCFDVIDEPTGGNDASLRPNQIFSVSLPISALSMEQQKSVVDVVARHLLTSHGLRSLGPSEPSYKGKYAGTARERDSAYHQGTIWAWLLGPFALAHYRVYKDPTAAQSFLEPLGQTIHSSGLGTISEIFGGDPPFHAAGCIAQAWSVGELVRAWHILSAARSPAKLS